MLAFWGVVTLISGFIGGCSVLYAYFFPGLSAVQQAASAAIGVGMGVAPYVIYRVLQGDELMRQVKQLVASANRANPPDSVTPASSPKSRHQEANPVWVFLGLVGAIVVLFLLAK